jgi:hypothetical protein
MKTLTSTEFKAKCLSILDEVAETGTGYDSEAREAGRTTST